MGKTRVKASTFKTKDLGKPGRGPKVLPPLEKGAFGGPGFFNRSQKEQERIAFARAEKMGERKVVGELRALQVLLKRTKPANSARANELGKKVAGSFKGKQKVGFPTGFAKNRAARSRKPAS